MSTDIRSQNTFVSLHGQSVEVAMHEHPSASDTILLLHEALGSVAYWKDFPKKLAVATGANVLLYSRAGHGKSEGPIPPRNLKSYLREAREVIPSLLAHFQLDCPILYGHSEGAALAILYTATSQLAKMLILESPFLVAAENSNGVIQNMAETYAGSHLQRRLARYHQDADAVFASWIAIVRSFSPGESPFREFLSPIACPVLVMQGENDEFETTRHLNALVAALPDVQHEMFADCGHLPHRQQTDRVVERVSRFLKRGYTP